VKLRLSHRRRRVDLQRRLLRLRQRLPTRKFRELRVISARRRELAPLLQVVLFLEDVGAVAIENGSARVAKN